MGLGAPIIEKDKQRTDGSVGTHHETEMTWGHPVGVGSRGCPLGRPYDLEQ